MLKSGAEGAAVEIMLTDPSILDLEAPDSPGPVLRVEIEALEANSGVSARLPIIIKVPSVIELIVVIIEQGARFSLRSWTGTTTDLNLARPLTPSMCPAPCALATPSGVSRSTSSPSSHSTHHPPYSLTISTQVTDKDFRDYGESSLVYQVDGQYGSV